jgi:hypothetical protein
VRPSLARSREPKMCVKAVRVMGRRENSSGRPGLTAWGGRGIARVAQDPSSLLCYIKEEQKIVFLCSVSDPT